MAYKRIVEITSGSGGNGISISDAYISFEVEKIKAETPNKARVDIYNLTDETARKIGKQGNNLIIKAGYEDEDGARAIFFGNIVKSLISKEGAEKVLKIEALDGYQDIQTKNAVLSYSENTKVSTILNDILGLFDYPLGNKLPPITDTYSGGFSFVGKAQTALSQVLSKIGYKYSIQNNQILIYKIGESAINTELILTPETGLLNISRKEAETEEGTPEQNDLLYEVETLLFPQIYPGAQIRLESKLYTGTGTVISALFEGDNFNGDFKVTAEVKAK